MGNQSIGTPRFYIDTVQYLKQIGFDFETHYNNYYWTDMGDDNSGVNVTGHYMLNTVTTHKDLFTLDAQYQKDPGWTGVGWRVFDVPTYGRALENEPNVGRYVAILNHNANVGTIHAQMTNMGYDDAGLITPTQSGSVTETEILNSTPYSFNIGTSIFGIESDAPGFTPDNDSYCFSRISFSDGDGAITWDNLRIGGISTGFYYDMPHSPDLKLTMETEFDGYDSITTLGGSTLTRTKYLGSPWWYGEDNHEIEPFGVYPDYSGSFPLTMPFVSEISRKSKRNGRRSWNLKFSYLSDSDLFAPNPMAGTYLENSAYINPDNTDQFNFGANKLGNSDFSIDVGADTNNTANNWWTDNNSTAHVTGTSVITGGECTVTSITEAEHLALEAAYSWTNLNTSITWASQNWAVAQEDVIGNGSWSPTDNIGMLGSAYNFEDSPDFAGWTVSSGCTIVIVDSSKTCRIVWTSADDYQKIVYSDILEDGVEYKLIYDIVANDGGGLMIENSPSAYLPSEVGVDREVTWLSDSTDLIIKRNNNASLGGAATGDIKIDNVRLYKKITDNVEIQRRKNAIYRVRFSAKKIAHGNLEHRFQVATGYYDFFRKALTDTYQTYECLFSFNGYRDGDTRDGWTSLANTAFEHSASHHLVMGIIGEADSGENAEAFASSVKVDWITLEVSNFVDFKTDINTDSSFQSVVLNKVGNGQKFIFQPDNTANNPGDFAICVLDQDSLKVTQVAHNTYNCAMKIKEVW